MTIQIPRSFIERVLLGGPDERRQLQESPVLGDVWIKFGEHPDRKLDLLITPHRTKTASQVAKRLLDRLPDQTEDPAIAFLQGIVVATLSFEQLLIYVVPMTEWWNGQRIRKEVDIYYGDSEWPEKLNRAINSLLAVARKEEAKSSSLVERERVSALDRYVALAGLLLWAKKAKPSTKRRKTGPASETPFDEAVKSVRPQEIADLLIELFGHIVAQTDREAFVYQVSVNRSATPAIARSIPAVKGDAAATLFAVNCSEITWAVIDSGIDATHPALQKTTPDGRTETRVVKSLDFTNIRCIVSLGNLKTPIRKRNIEALRSARSSQDHHLPEDADTILKELASDAAEMKPVDWARIEKLIELGQDEKPPSDHGTHVAGILGARVPLSQPGQPAEDAATGMCPDINLYDLRVLAPTLEDTEFAVIAALQYIRNLNARHRHITIHGANLSLSIPHDVRNYACGRTPVCVECEQLVENGVVVVAAAGNLGYQSFQTKDGFYDSYAAVSVTDPGNADSVITVGATHRYSPHTYGVSFFSSRGPTGDGRPKPDLVAPGERIRGPVLGHVWLDLDGTSMAAPHVSGAAAMLMARYSELIGQPRRIKRILCESATDLGRERSFQGHGMLDVLRAFQSV
ncbi:S8 family peptidase [Dongia sedimenti]|uniref:S8 family peptidase n=1 Tax=Dongia sedimenti TaxID=3064282 RepID=A0ABU0YRC7_9PROT|nr:S8 family peptidase [Rhodospirillaceae bacterium R-7]